MGNVAMADGRDSQKRAIALLREKRLELSTAKINLLLVMGWSDICHSPGNPSAPTTSVWKKLDDEGNTVFADAETAVQICEGELYGILGEGDE